MLQHWSFECNSCLRWWFFPNTKYPKCYMFLESSQKMLIEYHHDNVQIYGHGHKHVHLSIGLTQTPKVLYVFWTVTENADEMMPISIVMILVMSIFECFGSCWSCFLGPGWVLKDKRAGKQIKRSYWDFSFMEQVWGKAFGILFFLEIIKSSFWNYPLL